jgi:exonuclease SbcC
VLDALKEELTRREAALAEKQNRLEMHDKTAVAGDRERAQQELEALENQHGALVDEIATLQGKLTADGVARRSLADLLPAIAAQKWMLEQWSEMSALIGSADGKKFRTFAQGLTLDLLLDQANHHLHQLRPRYRLERVPGWDMELQVVDGDMGEEARPVGTLSGGETFLVSLSLALGLSSLSSKNVKIESLFIDEGFGHLDREALDVALSTLDQLQAEGRTIGLISHVPDIAERIGYQVRVEPKGPGRSEVRVVAR